MSADYALPAGIRSRMVSGVNGLTMHVLEAGFETPGRPALLLLHGFPELAYSWRKVMLPLAEAGHHVIAPDQRGYGRTVRTDGDDADYNSYDSDLTPFRLLNLVRDAIGLASALGYRSVAAVVGHDFGSPVAAWCALLRPDVFRSVVLMSAPFAGPPALPFNTAGQPAPAAAADIHAALAALPRPRKHYQWHYSTREADHAMHHAPQGLTAFLRAYYHVKSADWAQNQPCTLKSWTAEELAKMPGYYIMDLAKNMAEMVAPEMPSNLEISGCKWLTDAELSVYAGEFGRTGFQGALQWYRCRTSGRFNGELEVFSGWRIDVPALFIAGKADWGPFQRPGDIEAMRDQACSRLLGCHTVDGAGHWVQQEQPEQVVALVLRFMREQATA